MMLSLFYASKSVEGGTRKEKMMSPLDNLKAKKNLRRANASSSNKGVVSTPCGLRLDGAMKLH